MEVLQWEDNKGRHQAEKRWGVWVPLARTRARVVVDPRDVSFAHGVQIWCTQRMQYS